jgi:hypothetical protein
MQKLPTHRHKTTGHIVFWREDLPYKNRYELLPKDYWEKVNKEARISGEVAAIKAEAAKRILAKWPIYKQLNAMSEPDADWVKQMRKEIKAIRDWSNKAEAKLAK